MIETETQFWSFARSWYLSAGLLEGTVEKVTTQPFRQIDFSRSDISAVVAAMAEIAALVGAGGWVNIGPVLSDEQAASVPHKSGLAAWFSGRGPMVAMGTWMPAPSGGRPRATQVGVAHGQGANALKRLAEAGLELGDGWTKRQDHAKHGIVVEVANNVDLEDVVAWMVGAVTILTPDIDISDRFVAQLFRSV